MRFSYKRLSFRTWTERVPPWAEKKEPSFQLIITILQPGCHKTGFKTPGKGPKVFWNCLWLAKPLFREAGKIQSLTIPFKQCLLFPLPPLTPPPRTVNVGAKSAEFCFPTLTYGVGEGGVHVSFVSDCLFFGFCEKGVPYLGHVPKKKWLCLKWVENGLFGLKSHINKLYRSKEDPPKRLSWCFQLFSVSYGCIWGSSCASYQSLGSEMDEKIFFTPGIRKYSFPGWTKAWFVQGKRWS